MTDRDTGQDRRPPGALLSSAQERMRFLELLTPNTPLWLLRQRQRIRGALNVNALAQAVRVLQERHESLRTTFPSVDGIATQVVIDTVRDLSIHDLRGLDAAARDEQLASLELAQAERFDLEAAPPVRFTLARIADDEFLLWLTMHHIVYDAWSDLICMRELDELYTAAVAGRAPRLAPPRVTYRECAAAECMRLGTDAHAQRLDYWRRHLRDVQPVALPVSRVASPSQRAAKQDFELTPDVTDRLRVLCGDEEMTLFVGLLAAFDILLARYSGVDDIAVTIPVDTRGLTSARNVVGLFVNTVVLRADLTNTQSFRDALRVVSEVVRDGLAHQDVPFEEVAGAVRAARGVASPSLFNVMFSMHGLSPRARIGDLAVDVEWAERTDTAFDLTLVVVPQADRSLTASLEYKADLFDHAIIEQMARHFVHLLEQVTSRPDERLVSIDMLDDDERQKLLAQSKGPTASSVRSTACLHELFETHVDRSPDAVAVQLANQRLTYRELDTRANQLAHHLRALGVGPEVRVALHMHRTAEILVGIIGILKAGGTYVPIEPSTPRERTAFILDDSDCRVAVVDADLADDITRAGLRVVRMRDTDREPSSRLPGAALASTLAYVIYTSGSTGRPKGVMVEHGMAVNVVLGMAELEKITPSDRVLQFASFAFDLSVQDVFAALSRGATIVMRGDDVPSPAELYGPQFAGVTVMNLSAAYWHTLATAGPPPPSVRVVGIGGERPSPVHVRAWSELAPRCVLLNCYGPTEATITATAWQLRSGALLPGHEVPIGGPLPGYAAYVLDANLHLTPVGVAGELYLAGAGIARGYLERAALTAERFVPNPFDEGRLYRTGDLVRRLPDGNLEYLGRIDHQVKVRGYRIELGEIESVLCSDASVRDAVVVARDGLLVAYVVPGDGFDASTARTRIGTQLPDYMVPSAFVTLDAMPLTANGKLDRNALPPPARDAFARHEYIEPRTAEERQLAAIWQDLLATPRVGPHDNFFSLGGHSLLAIRLVVEMERAFAVKVSLRDVFVDSTLAGLAARISRARGVTALERPQLYASAVRRTRLPPALRGVLKLDRAAAANNLLRHVWSAWIDGRIDVRALDRALTAMRERHALLRTRFFTDNGFDMLEVLDPAEAQRFALLEQVDFSALSGVEQERADADFHKKTAERPLDLAKGEVLTAGLSSWSPTRHHFTVVIHNIASDTQTVTVFVEELCTLWRAFTENADCGTATILPPVPLQYHHVADYLARLAESEAGRAQRAFWQEQLAGMEPLALPIDRPRDQVDALRDANAGIVSFRAGGVSAEIGKEVLAAITRVANDQRASVMATLIAALAGYLSERTSQRDIAFVTRLSQRYLPDVQRTLGFLVNPLVLRISTDHQPSFRKLVAKTQQVVTNAFDCGECDLFTLAPPGAFRFCIDYNELTTGSNDDSSLRLPSGVVLTQARDPSDREMRIGYDAMLWASLYSDRITLYLAYSRELFFDSSAAAFLAAFVERFATLCREPDRPCTS